MRKPQDILWQDRSEPEWGCYYYGEHSLLPICIYHPPEYRQKNGRYRD
ncbi:MAG TPA: hypothetical protein IAC31_06775 [Candidatus Faecousia intestinigallinarum]|nr:hypothetical protein [Candidatus Faecousia intestinigallinarum]